MSVTSLIHHHLWQRLPRTWRRSALFRASVLFATRPSADAEASEPILVAGALSTASGLGQSARLCHDALRAASVPVLGIDLTGPLRQPRDVTEFRFVDGRNHVGPGTLILHVNSPLIPLALTHLRSRLIRFKRIIGYWAWELPQVPREWRHGIPFMHEIWVPSQFTADALRPMVGDRPLRVVPHPVALHHSSISQIRRNRDRPFTVLSIFNMASSMARKNPLAAIAAFREAFGDDPSARLIVKASNGSCFPAGLRLLHNAVRAGRNMVLVSGTVTADEVGELYNSSDVVVSLHRSEGFGLIIAEAMLHGLPVVATDWSGSVDFLNARNGIPVSYRLVQTNDPQGFYHHPEMMWAEANVGAAAEALCRLRRDANLSRSLGQEGACYARRNWNANSYAKLVRALLRL